MKKPSLPALVAGILFLAAAAAVGGAESPGPAKPAGPTATALFPETSFEFAPVLEGVEVTHDFLVKNTGEGVLAIERVQTG